LVNEWQKTSSTISTGVYPDGDSELVQAKWLLLDNHVDDIHKRCSTKFPMCSHNVKIGGKNGLKDVSGLCPQYVTVEYILTE